MTGTSPSKSQAWLIEKAVDYCDMLVCTLQTRQAKYMRTPAGDCLDEPKYGFVSPSAFHTHTGPFVPRLAGGWRRKWDLDEKRASCSDLADLAVRGYLCTCIRQCAICEW